MMGGFGMMAGMGWLGYVTMIVFWIGILLLVIWSVSTPFPTTRQPSSPDSIEILRRRFARGEISREEFEQARLVLQA